MTAERPTGNGGTVAKLTAEERALMKKLLADDEALAEAEEDGDIEEIEPGEEVEPGETITIGGKRYRVIEVPGEVEEEIEEVEEKPKARKVVKKSTPIKKTPVRRVKKVIADDEDEEIEDEPSVDPEPQPARKRFLS